METQTSRSVPRIVRLTLVAAGLASAWILLTLVLGVGSSDAHADDAGDRGAVGGLLGPVIDGTTAAVTDAATQTVGTVTTVVRTTVQSAPLPAPAAEVAGPVIGTVSTAVAGVSDSVSTTASSGLVAPVADAAAGLVSRTPIVGGVAEGLGVEEVLASLGDGIGGTVDGVTDAIGDTAGAIGPPWRPLPTDPGATLPGADAATGIVSQSAAETAAGRAPASLAERATASTGALLAASAPPAASRAASLTAAAALFPLGHAAPTDASSAGPGGSGPGAWGLLAFGPLVAYRAWVRRRGPDDERVPAAPFFATDVSPD